MDKQRFLKLVAQNTFKTLGQIFAKLAEEMEAEKQTEEKEED